MSKQTRRPAKPAVNAVARPPKASRAATVQRYFADKTGRLRPQDATPSAIDTWRESLLQTDARIITDNDTDIVLSIRISRDWLRDNHHLLAALSDAATGAN